MDPRAFCSSSDVVIVAGKGGVGKTTVAAALALSAARAGVDTLLVDIEATGALPALFGRTEPLGYRPVTLAEPAGGATVRGRSLTPDDALLEYLEDHGLRRVSRRMLATGTLDLVATAIPGIRDILILGKVRQLEQSGDSGLIIVDAPAAGHAVAFLASARGLLDAIPVGPIRTQSAQVDAMLTDPTRCQVLLVTLPEETPVNEAVETAFHLEDRAGIKLGPIVANGVFPQLDLPEDVPAAAAAGGAHLDGAELEHLAAAATFRLRRQDLQRRQLTRLSERLPLPQLVLPYLWTTNLGPSDVGQLAEVLSERIVGLDTQRTRR